MRRASIGDVMRETGLSRATVDRALNGRGGVHPRTMLAIEDTLRRLRQVPARPSPGAGVEAGPDQRKERGRGDEGDVAHASSVSNRGRRSQAPSPSSWNANREADHRP